MQLEASILPLRLSWSWFGSRFRYARCVPPAPFLNEYFLGSRSMGGSLAMTPRRLISASSFIGGPGVYKYGLGWVLLKMIQLPASVWLSLGILGKNCYPRQVAIMPSRLTICYSPAPRPKPPVGVVGA